jgi:predicted HAD superfamily phosphohydrolase
MKLRFSFDGKFAENAEEGYDAPVESELLHRFTLVDGVVVDKYEGVSDDEVKVIDHAEAIDRALNNLNDDGEPEPLEPPPALDYVSPPVEETV